MKDLSRVFRDIDRDQTGQISMQELEKSMEEIV